MELIRITEHNGKKAVSARDLHRFLEVKTDLVIWCKRMFEYGFEKDVDYTVIKSENPINQQVTIKDFVLTIDAAKEISMLQRTEKGKEARKYFIDCENKVVKAQNVLSEMANDPFIQLRMSQIKTEQLLEDQNERLKIVEAKTTTRVDMFTIAGYATLQGVQVNLSTASKLGRAATKICNDRNLITDKISDPRWGVVKMYPTEVLNEVFENENLSV